VRRRKRWWIVGLAIGVPLLIVAGFAVAFLVSSPRPPDLAEAVTPKEIPAAWLDVPGREPPADEPDIAAVAYTSSGVLAMVGNGKPFGEEAYTLAIAADGAKLTSTGRFWFKVVLATVTISFDQSFVADGSLRPARYEGEFHAPLGFNRSVLATFEGNRATVLRGEKADEVTIEPDRALVVGTFATYTLVPRLFELRQRDGEATMDALFFGGVPNQDGAADGFPTVTITRAGTANVRAGDVELIVDRYLVQSGLGTSELFARGDEFLAFRTADGSESLLVYRADYFPDGFVLSPSTE
jgi:hypothetical protein